MIIYVTRPVVTTDLDYIARLLRLPAFDDNGRSHIMLNLHQIPDDTLSTWLAGRGLQAIVAEWREDANRRRLVELPQRSLHSYLAEHHSDLLRIYAARRIEIVKPAT